MPNLTVTEAAMVKVSNILVERTCNAARELTKMDKRWIIENRVENPVRRNDSDGPWKRFNSGKFPNHASLW